MNMSRGILSLLIAVLVAIGAVMVASKWLKQKGSQESHIVVAAHDINLGQKIEPSMIKLVAWPGNMLPPGALQSLDKLEGRVVKTVLFSGDILLESKLAPEGETGGLAAVIPAGKRAITVKVNEVVGVAGFALPGNYVDVVVNAKQELHNNNNNNNSQQSISKIVLQHILVLAVGEEMHTDDSKPKKVNAVTLEVTPEQAEKIDLARSVGELSLVLRNQSDINESQTSGITVNSLLGVQTNDAPTPVQSAPSPVITRAAAPSQKASNKMCVKVVSGVSEHTECF